METRMGDVGARTYTVYKYDELSDGAKEKAREWYTSSWDCFDSEYIIEDAAEIADLMGIDLRQTLGNNGKYKPTVYWSGFSSQGDGACFECSYRYKKGSVKAVKDYAPKDTELHEIARVLYETQKKYFYKLAASTNHRGHYYHEYCMDVSVYDYEDSYRGIPADDEETITECLRDFARWIYRRLEAEYDYQTSEEAVAETLIANEYDFTEDGAIS